MPQRQPLVPAERLQAARQARGRFQAVTEACPQARMQVVVEVVPPVREGPGKQAVRMGAPLAAGVVVVQTAGHRQRVQTARQAMAAMAEMVTAVQAAVQAGIIPQALREQREVVLAEVAAAMVLAELAQQIPQAQHGAMSMGRAVVEAVEERVSVEMVARSAAAQVAVKIITNQPRG